MTPFRARIRAWIAALGWLLVGAESRRAERADGAQSLASTRWALQLVEPGDAIEAQMRTQQIAMFRARLAAAADELEDLGLVDDARRIRDALDG